MVKSITKVGNSQGLILDAALLDLARLKAVVFLRLNGREPAADGTFDRHKATARLRRLVRTPKG